MKYIQDHVERDKGWRYRGWRDEEGWREEGWREEGWWVKEGWRDEIGWREECWRDKEGWRDEEGWRDDGVYGGLLAIRDICRLEHLPFDDDALQTLCDAMNQGNPLRVRQIVYDIMLATQDQWLKLESLHQKLEHLGFFRKLHSVVVEIARSDCQGSFLKMTETLSQDTYWDSYLRRNMDIWLPLRYDGPEHTLRIIRNIAGLPFVMQNDYGSSPLDNFLQRLMVGEWAAVPGRQVCDLTADRLIPLAEITEGFNKELLFNDYYQRAVLAEVERVIPGLERRHDSGYEGPGEDVRDVINDLVAKLRPLSRCRFSDNWEVKSSSSSYVVYRTDSRCALMLY